MVCVGILPGKHPDARLHSVDPIELRLALDLVDDQTVRAVVDRYTGEEVENSQLLRRWLSLLVLCRTLLDRLHHSV